MAYDFYKWWPGLALLVSATICIGGIDFVDSTSDVFYSEDVADKRFDLRALRASDAGVERWKREAETDVDEDEHEDEFGQNATLENGGAMNESVWANATRYQVSHRYYTVIKRDELDEYWQDVEALLAKKGGGDPQHKQLSNSYRRAVSQKLSFKFPFYGHYVENVTIATGGFVYVGEHVHSWLAATQYIAPLMANFDTTTSNDASVLAVDTGDMLVVEWHQVVLRHQAEAGNFTFQVVLHKNGDIWFAYKRIPIMVKRVSDLHHPLKVGLSDAYLFTHTVLTMSRRVIYEYHRIELPLEDVRSGVVFEIKAMPVCISYQTCGVCMNSTLAQFNCSWCAVDSEHGGPFCSDEAGLHRRRQDWLNAQCNKQMGQVYCSADDNQQSSNQQTNRTTGHDTTVPEKFVAVEHAERKVMVTRKIESDNGLSSGAVVALLLALGSVVGLVGWVVYAYYNPHTPSGQFLIRYRPARWRLPGNHGDVRYTASVHM